MSRSNHQPVSEPEFPKRFLDWLRTIGPGAIVASVTIGTGELIFSTRGGALFGYRILFLFVMISILKWGLVLSSARHFVITGVHPYQRMMEIPGPRGWFPLALFLMATFSVPIWISFHAGVVGNLTSWITNSRDVFHGGMDYLWGAIILTSVLLIAFAGGYSALERIQIAIVGALVVCAAISLLLYKPDWIELITGAIIPQRLTYPDWLAAKYPSISEKSVWIESTRYVGVVGGAGFDYMAYTSFIREKRWGNTGLGPTTDQQLNQIAADPQHPVRRWLRAPLVDLTISFITIIVFCAVFVASGALVLGPNEIVPDEKNLLNLQSQFVTRIHPWLLPLYVAGAFLAMFGTLYGTLEIGCSITDELGRCAFRNWSPEQARRSRRGTIVWCAVFAYAVLVWLFVRQATYEPPPIDAPISEMAVEELQQQSTTPMPRLDKPRLLLAILTPVNLFTGVLSCGLFCAANIWMDARFLPSRLRSYGLIGINLFSALVFLMLGLKGYWENENRWIVVAGILGIFTTSVILTSIWNSSTRKSI